MSEPGADGASADFALVAVVEDGRWLVSALPPRLADDLHTLLTTLRQQPSESGAIGLVSYGDDFFVVARVRGEEVRLLLSDATAATEWLVAREVLDALDLPMSDEDDAVMPAGDLEIFADFGLTAMELAALCADLDLYPDEVLAGVAARLGFKAQFEQLVEAGH